MSPNNIEILIMLNSKPPHLLEKTTSTTSCAYTQYIYIYTAFALFYVLKSKPLIEKNGKDYNMPKDNNLTSLFSEKKNRKAEFLGVKGRKEVSSEAYNHTEEGSCFKIFT